MFQLTTTSHSLTKGITTTILGTHFDSKHKAVETFRTNMIADNLRLMANNRIQGALRLSARENIKFLSEAKFTVRDDGIVLINDHAAVLTEIVRIEEMTNCGCTNCVK